MLESLLNSISSTTSIGQIEFTTVGTHNWTVPAGVYDISGVVISAGGYPMFGAGFSVAGGTPGGGGLCWFSGLEVKPGDVITVVVGGVPSKLTNSANQHGQNSRLSKNSTIIIDVQGGRGGGSNVGGAGGTILVSNTPVFGGGSGGKGGSLSSGRSFDVSYSGGGCGGYAGSGGNGAASTSGTYTQGTSGSGGGGSGGSRWMGAGGTSLRGLGVTGQYIDFSSSQVNAMSGTYVGHVGSPVANVTTRDSGHYGAGTNQGAARIIWGSGRSYPSNRVANES